MQAEEYDLSFRLANAGWDVRVFDDLHVDHLKTACSRRAERTTFFDVRNNLRLVARYLPRTHCRVYRQDWIVRYGWLAERHGHQSAFAEGIREARANYRVERRRFRSQRLRAGPLERFFGWYLLEGCMKALARRGARRIVLADLGKNVFAFYRGARSAGIEVQAIGDDRFQAPGRRYRGIPVIEWSEALSLEPDAIVVAQTVPVFAERALTRVQGQTKIPALSWVVDEERSRPKGASLERPLPVGASRFVR
jgi:hypothetical protein